jgi:hypothetical protein
MDVAELNSNGDTKFRISVEDSERAELARFLDVDRIDRLTFSGFISPYGEGGWRIRGHLVAKIEQSCVITLEPVSSRHDAELERIYLPADQIPDEQEVHISHDDQDLPDPFTDSIDPAQLAVESLALMIDAFPRAEGAEMGQRTFAAPGVTPLSDEESKPFASLAALKSGSGNADA